MATVTSSRTWTESEIAALSSTDIARLNYDEMLELIHQAQSSLVPGDASLVTESEVVVRHVYALWHRCRSQMTQDS